VSPIGKIEPNEDVSLADIRRPAFFGQSVYNENIAKHYDFVKHFLNTSDVLIDNL
jgi:hypothetical protein